jgi:ABC-2 type transport system ATP-binding protein
VLGQRNGKVADDKVGYLPEERGLYKRMKVYDLLAYYARLKNVVDYKTEIDYWLAQFDATDWGPKKIETLSKGMAQKVQFIAAAIHRPQLLVLDEPFSGLDPVNMESLRDAVLAMRESGTTIVFSTHDMDLAERLCDTIFMIFKGRKVLDGTLHEIQDAYPADRVRARLSDPEAALPDHPDISDVVPNGRFFDFRISDPTRAQPLLADLADRCALDYFEVRRPSLHDIFVQIAGPEAEEDARHEAAAMAQL